MAILDHSVQLLQNGNFEEALQNLKNLAEKDKNVEKSLAPWLQDANERLAMKQLIEILRTQSQIMAKQGYEEFKNNDVLKGLVEKLK